MSLCIRIVALFLLLSLFLLPITAKESPTYTLPAPRTAPPALSAEAAVLLDAQSGTPLMQKNADARLPMASTTKIMTALLALERLDEAQIITVPPEAVGVEGSSVYLFAGEQISVGTLLYALLLSSANDAAVALAIATAGSVAAFADAMNEKAAELGLTDTHFCNPHGLHDEAHYTTARDLARLAAAAMQNERFAEIVSTRRHTAAQNGTDATRLFLNHNKLLSRYEGAVGIKTGFTKKSGRCLVSAARRDGLLLIAVTLNAPSDWQDHANLFDWGFSEYCSFTPDVPDITLPVVGGTAREVTLRAADPPSLTLPADAEVHCITEAPRFLFGGFAEGEVKGRLVCTLDGEQIAEVPLITDAAVERERPAGLFARLRARLAHIFSK